MRDSPFLIRPLRESDRDAVLRIYAEGIATGDATFETEAPPWERWDAGHRRDCRLGAVETPGTTPAEFPAEDEGGGVGLVGWAALSPVSTRAVYAGVAEVSVYVAARARGRGLGRALLASLVSASEAAGVWTLQASVFPENTASIGLHESLGFRRVGVRERIAARGGRWRDTVILERRSAVAGNSEGLPA